MNIYFRQMTYLACPLFFVGVVLRFLLGAWCGGRCSWPPPWQVGLYFGGYLWNIKNGVRYVVFKILHVSCGGVIRWSYLACSLLCGWAAGVKYWNLRWLFSFGGKPLWYPTWYWLLFCWEEWNIAFGLGLCCWGEEWNHFCGGEKIIPPPRDAQVDRASEYGKRNVGIHLVSIGRSCASACHDFGNGSPYGLNSCGLL